MAREPRLPVTLSRNFDGMPPVARAEVLFISCTELTWRGFLTGGPLVWKMFRRLKRTPGFVCHKGFFSFPLTTGAYAFFDGIDSLQDFARSKEHMALVTWGKVPGRIRSGFIRIMRTAPTGSAFGEWIAADELDSLDRRRLLPVVSRETDWSTPASAPVSTSTPSTPRAAPVITGCPHIPDAAATAAMSQSRRTA